uniref:Uncharacterized protein n=1 Tax=Oryza brachyantha TaxID=4533 RepID=J3N8A4_ORYBR
MELVEQTRTNLKAMRFSKSKSYLLYIVLVYYACHIWMKRKTVFHDHVNEELLQQHLTHTMKSRNKIYNLITKLVHKKQSKIESVLPMS